MYQWRPSWCVHKGSSVSHGHFGMPNLLILLASILLGCCSLPSHAVTAVPSHRFRPQCHQMPSCESQWRMCGARTAATGGGTTTPRSRAWATAPPASTATTAPPPTKRPAGSQCLDLAVMLRSHIQRCTASLAKELSQVLPRRRAPAASAQKGQKQHGEHRTFADKKVGHLCDCSCKSSHRVCYGASHIGKGPPGQHDQYGTAAAKTECRS